MAHQTMIYIISIILGVGLLSITYYYFADFGPNLIIDELGIQDKSLGVGLIEWEDVVSAHLDTNYNQHYLSVHVRNAEKYLSRLGEPRRSKFILHRELGFTSFSVPISSVNCDPVQFLADVQNRIETAVK